MSKSADDVLAKAVASGAVPGVVALAADPEGEIFASVHGHTGPDGASALRMDSVFRIASMTKAITATAAMQLVEQGRLELDKPVKTIVPEVGEARVLTGFDAAGKPQTRAPDKDVTLRHLLTHTSGYSYDLFNKNVARYMEHEGLPSIVTCLNDSLRAPLLFDPGTRWEYGIGIDWAGKMVEAVSGQSLEDYLQAHICGPLGMRDTSFVARDDMRDRLVSACARDPSGALSAIEFEFPADADFHMGGGGLLSTAPDYLRFTRMLLGRGSLDGVTVLKPETVALMGENSIGDIEVPPLVSDNPAMAITAEMFPGQIKRWGLSFIINTENVDGCRAAGSLAWAGVHNTFFWIDPASELTAVIMMQLLPANDPQVLKTLGGFEHALYAGLRQ